MLNFHAGIYFTSECIELVFLLVLFLIFSASINFEFHFIFIIHFKTYYRLMQVKSIAECSKGRGGPLEHYAILSTFIMQPFVIKIFVLSIFEWPLMTGFIVLEPVHGRISIYRIGNQQWLRRVCAYAQSHGSPRCSRNKEQVQKHGSKGRPLPPPPPPPPLSPIG